MLFKEVNFKLDALQNNLKLKNKQTCLGLRADLQNSDFQGWVVGVHLKLPGDSGAASLVLLKGLASESHGAVLGDI